MKFSEDMGGANYRITGYGDSWVMVNQDRLANQLSYRPTNPDH